MKILHLCLGNFYIDGYSYQENMLPKYHVKQGHDVLVITSLYTFNSEGKKSYLPSPSHYRDENGYEVIRLGYAWPVCLNRFLRHFIGLQDAINSFSPDIIFSHNVSYGDTGIVRDYLHDHPDVKLFADNHGDYINSAKNWLSKNILHPIIWKHFSKLIEPYMVRCYGVTPMRCRFLKEMYHVNPEKIEYLPLGVDDDLIPQDKDSVKRKIRKEFNLKDEDFLIITGGKIGKLKNIHFLIDAFKILNDPHLHLLLCGVLTPEMEYLKKEIENNSSIHYLGWCDAKKVMNCMIAADLAVFPGTHSTLWEQSVGVGLPAVFKRWPEMEHVNVNGNCVFVKGEDVDELVEILKELSLKDVRYEKLKQLSKEASKSLLYSEIARRAIEF